MPTCWQCKDESSTAHHDRVAHNRKELPTGVLTLNGSFRRTTLRGINVGRGNRVPMAALRRILGDLGYTHVTTLLNSGNAVFCAPQQPPDVPARQVSAALEQQLGVSVPIIVKTKREFLAAVAGNPVAVVPEASRLLVTFTRRRDELAALRALEEQLVPGEFLHVCGHAAYLHCPAGISDSRAAAALLGKMGRNATTRNWATTLKIAALLADLPPGDAPESAPLHGMT